MPTQPCSKVEKNDLIFTVCTCATIPKKFWKFVYIWKLSINNRYNYVQYIFMSLKDRCLVGSAYCQLNLASTSKRWKLYALYTKAKMFSCATVVKHANDSTLQCTDFLTPVGSCKKVIWLQDDIVLVISLLVSLMINKIISLREHCFMAATFSVICIYILLILSECHSTKIS